MERVNQVDQSATTQSTDRGCCDDYVGHIDCTLSASESNKKFDCLHGAVDQSCMLTRLHDLCRWR